MSKHASLHILTSKMKKDIRIRYKQEVEEMIEDELRYQMIKLAEIDSTTLNKLAAEKQVQKIIKKRMTMFLSEAHPD